MQPQGPRRPWWRVPFARDVHWAWTPVLLAASIAIVALQVLALLRPLHRWW